MGARGKDEVLPQPDESILSGGTVQSTSMRDSDTRTDYQGTQELFVVNSVKCFFFFSTLMQLSCIQKTLAQRTKIKAPSIIIPLTLIK